MTVGITVLRKQKSFSRKQTAVSLAENTKIYARITQMRKQIAKLRKQTAISLAENTKMTMRITEMSKRTGKMKKQMAYLSIAKGCISLKSASGYSNLQP
jgi:regulator of replication initiation timing